MKTSLVWLCFGVAALTGCASDEASLPTTSAESSPVITASNSSGGGTPVTLSGYTDTSVTTQTK